VELLGHFDLRSRVADLFIPLSLQPASTDDELILDRLTSSRSKHKAALSVQSP